MAKNLMSRFVKSWCVYNSSRILSMRPLVKRNYAAINIDDDGDTVPEGMKTKVTLLSQDEESNFSITAYSSLGFLLNTGIRVMGPCVMFPKSVLHWNIRGVEDINENSLSLFPMLEPKLDILIIGVGEQKNMPLVNPNVIGFLKTNKINVEILSTEQALATYNFLTSEKRYVAGAFIPPQFIVDEIAERHVHYSNLSDDDSVYVSGGHGKDFFLGSMSPNTDDDNIDMSIPSITKEERKIYVDQSIQKFRHGKNINKDSAKEPTGDQH